MTDSVIETILRDIQAQLAKVNTRLDAIESRLTSIEHHVAGLVVSDMRRNTEIAELQVRVDRIERRLDITT